MPLAFRLPTLLLSATALCGPAAALAQTQAAPTVLEEIVVTTASGIATSIQDAPASITVIDQKAIQASGARNVKDVLRTVPGLNLTRGNDGNSNVSFRGLSSSRTLTLVDGKRIGSRNTFARHYQGDLQIVPLDAIDRIEVVRGPMSTLYGSDAMGGVINIITRKSSDAWTGAVTTDFGFADDNTTADSRSVSAYLSGPLGRNRLAIPRTAAVVVGARPLTRAATLVSRLSSTYARPASTPSTIRTAARSGSMAISGRVAEGANQAYSAEWFPVNSARR